MWETILTKILTLWDKCIKLVKSAYNYLLHFIAGLFGFQFQIGSITLLSHENATVTIPLLFAPKRVFIAPGHSTGIPVCQGDIDSFDVRLLPDGFVLFIRLTSECREIRWFARNW